MYVEILLVLAALVVLFLIFVALRPSGFSITRSAAMQAAPATVFAQVNDFHHWAAWSPWDKIDPNLKRIYEGPPSGAGAIYRWEGNKNVGCGGMTIVESRPSDLISIKLEFLKPFKATNAAEFTFKPDGKQTLVTWTMIGKCNFMMKGVGLFMSMDKMIGGQFEKGLEQLKAIAEASSNT